MQRGPRGLREASWTVDGAEGAGPSLRGRALGLLVGIKVPQLVWVTEWIQEKQGGSGVGAGLGPGSSLVLGSQAPRPRDQQGLLSLPHSSSRQEDHGVLGTGAGVGAAASGEGTPNPAQSHGAQGEGRPAPPGQKSQAKGCSPSPEMALAQRWPLHSRHRSGGWTVPEAGKPHPTLLTSVNRDSRRGWTPPSLSRAMEAWSTQGQGPRGGLSWPLGTTDPLGGRTLRGKHTQDTRTRPRAPCLPAAAYPLAQRPWQVGEPPPRSRCRDWEVDVANACYWASVVSVHVYAHVCVWLITCLDVCTCVL